MARQIQNEYAPDVVSAPGDTLSDALEALGMTQKELAGRTGLSRKTVNQIIKAKAPITPETALHLERALGMPARFWNNREQRYREHLARVQEKALLASQIDWLRTVPVRRMVKLGWIAAFEDKVQQLQEVLSFFGVASPDEWEDLWRGPQVAYRKSPAFEQDPMSAAAWLRHGELLAQKIACEPYNEAGFREALSGIRRITPDAPETWDPNLKAACAPCGVAVVLVRELPESRVYGAARWLSPTKALIQLSLRGKSDDRLWFSFFHEAGHILLHGKRLVFVDGDEDSSPMEAQADKFAQDALIPAGEYERFLAAGQPTKDRILAFAQRLRIAPGIVVGRLQHDTRVYSRWNELKVKLAWSSAA